MPQRAPRPCLAPGCQRLLHGRARCPEHGVRQIKAASSESRNQRQALYTGAWAKASKAFLMRNPVCLHCLREGLSRRATVTDHTVPHRGDTELFWRESNWQALCKRHHDRKSLRDEGMPQTRPESLPLPACRVVLVCGPPASGKTSYVREQRSGDDLVIDLDEIFASLTGKTPHAPRNGKVAETLVVRNSMLVALAAERPDRKAFVIVGAPVRERAWWQRKLQPERTVVMNTPRAECEARIHADPERRAVAAAQIAAVRRWWHAEVGA